MATTAQQVFDIAMDLIDERLDTGEINPNTLNYKVKTPGILTLGQFELFRIGEIYKTFEFSNIPVQNMFGTYQGFEMTEYLGEDLIYTVDGTPKTYYFEVDAPCTVYIEEFTTTWSIIDTINYSAVTDEPKFVAFKGSISPSGLATAVRYRFTPLAPNSYYFRTQNRAFFKPQFQEDRIPEYRPWIKKQLPPDFKSLDQVIREYPTRQYDKDSKVKWEGKNDFYFDYYFEGSMRIIYKPVPERVTNPNLTDVLQLDDVTATTILPYYLATHLMLDENSSLASYFNQRFMELKAFAMQPRPVGEQVIVNVYGSNQVSGSD
jgi:hypothetical protein